MSRRSEVLDVDALERTGARLIRERFGRDCQHVGRVGFEWGTSKRGLMEWQEVWTFYYEAIGDAEPSYYDITTMPDGSLCIQPIGQEQVPYSLLSRPAEQRPVGAAGGCSLFSRTSRGTFAPIPRTGP